MRRMKYIHVDVDLIENVCGQGTEVSKPGKESIADRFSISPYFRTVFSARLLALKHDSPILFLRCTHFFQL